MQSNTTHPDECTSPSHVPCVLYLACFMIDRWSVTFRMSICLQYTDDTSEVDIQKSIAVIREIRIKGAVRLSDVD